MSEIQRQIDLLQSRAKQIEGEQARTLITIGDTLSREVTLLMSQVTDKLRAMEQLHDQFLHEAEDLRTVVLRACEGLLDKEVQLRHNALLLAPELDGPPAAIEAPVEPPKQITDETGEQGMILELGETVERRKRKAAG